MLIKAMECIKLPSCFINIIKGLFINRKNKVFTAFGSTDPFDMLTGIDQGEVISPILWCIYYDPLLTRLEKEKLGYVLESNSKEINVPAKAYMDDTTLITSNQDNMEQSLEIADEFYLLNDIQINHGKAELLLRKEDNDNDNNAVMLEFNNKSITIIPKKSSESMRILGVYFNINNKRQFLLNFIRKIIIDFTNLIRNKDISEKIIKYAWNSLIIPQIEFRSQTMVLTKKECDNFMYLFREIIKQKWQLCKSTPNIVFNNLFMYGCKDLYKNQLESKVVSFFIQINDPNILDLITDIQLDNLQNSFHLGDSILKGIDEHLYSKQGVKKYHDSYLVKMIKLMEEHEIQINFDYEPISDVENYRNNILDSEISMDLNEALTKKREQKPIFTRWDNLDNKISFHAFIRKLTKVENYGTFNHLIIDDKKTFNNRLDLEFCTGCSKDNEIYKYATGKNENLCRNTFNLEDLIPLNGSKTRWNRSQKNSKIKDYNRNCLFHIT
jgi:hypothetical protein